jgi:signal peptidase II
VRVACPVAAFVVAVDQLSKAYVLGHVSPGPHHLLGPLGVRVGRNTGVAFSLFTGHSAVALAVTLVLTAVVAAYALRAASAASGVVLGLLVGGAIGNDIDRIARSSNGGVVDFLTLPHWPTFNLADTAITLGAIGLVALVALRRPVVTGHTR